jgi:hypothetical protein
MSNVKAGDLCLVVGMRHTPEANGHFVEAVGTIHDGYMFSDGMRLDNREGCSMVWLVRGRSIPVRTWGGRLDYTNERGIADEFLRPITPPAGTVSDSEVTELFKSDTAPMVTKEAA